MTQYNFYKYNIMYKYNIIFIADQPCMEIKEIVGSTVILDDISLKLLLFWTSNYNFIHYNYNFNKYNHNFLYIVFLHDYLLIPNVSLRANSLNTFVFLSV